MTNFEKVRIFMEKFGQEIREKASFPNEKITDLRYDLIKEELDELKALVIYKMEAAVNLAVPMVAEVGTGKNWLEAH